MRIVHKNRSRGSATIELAICLPVLVLLVFGTIEVSNSIFVKQTLTSAAHEGALVGMRSNSTEQQIIDRVDGILASRNVSNCVINILPTGTSFEALAPGETFHVQVGCPSSYQFIGLEGVSVSVGSQRQ